ncbi:MAG: NAD(P)-dependent oxidoreductase [Desulfovibrionaceae bacterium]|nr:NAD(P)-dependent oxidoreductase [Desulfovibrionaceae bacterium]
MRITAYSVRPDEEALFAAAAARLGIELVTTPQRPTLDTAHLAADSQGVSVITTPIRADLLAVWRGYGVQAVSTRTVGYDHMDLDAAGKLGIRMSNVSYTPWTVAEHTVMAMLMCLRRTKLVMRRYEAQDYTLKAVRGRELRGRTVGIVGTGAIGCSVAELLSSFGCTLLAHSRSRNPRLEGLAEYVSLDELLGKSDIVTLHLPAVPGSEALMNAQRLARMKEGAILVNTARGPLVDTDALIDALESGHLGGAALDVITGEGPVHYRDFKGKIPPVRAMSVLQAMPNVLMTPHTAFFTDEAVGDMINYSLQSLKAAALGEEDRFFLN